MKKAILIFALITFSLIGNAQSFFIENGKILWQHTFESDLDATEIVKAMHMSGKFTNIEIVDSTFVTARLTPQTAEIEKYGYRRMHIPIYLANNDFGPAKIIIQIKPGVYRATATNMILTDATASQLSGGSLTAFAIQDNTFSSVFVKEPVVVYHDILMNCLTFEKVENDW